MGSHVEGPVAVRRRRGATCSCELLETRRMLASAYSITDLGAVVIGEVPYTTFSELMSVNNAGDTVFSNAGDQLHTGGKTIALNSFSAKLLSATPLMINGGGQIVGSFPGPRTFRYPFLDPITGFPEKDTVRLPDAFVYDGQGFRDISPGTATGINASGEIVGMHTILQHPGPGDYNAPPPEGGLGTAVGAWVYLDGRRHSLRLPPHVRGKDIAQVGITDSGNVILATDKGVYQYPPDLRKPVQIFSQPFQSAVISSSGEVAGVSTASQVAYFAKPGLTMILQSLDSAPVTPHGINAEGDVVGADGSQGFLWKDGVMQNLNTLAPPAETGWTIQTAQAINDVGQIAAWGIDAAFSPHFLLLTPLSGT